MNEAERRFQRLKALIGEHMGMNVNEAEVAFLWLLCDGCGRTVAVDVQQIAVPEGWELRGPDHDYCPTCVASGRFA